MKISNIFYAYVLCIIAILVATFAIIIGTHLSGIDSSIWMKCARWYCIIDGVLTILFAVFYIVMLIITQVKFKNKEV